MDLYTSIWTVNTHVNDTEGLVTAKVCAYKLNNARYEKNVCEKEGCVECAV